MIYWLMLESDPSFRIPIKLERPPLSPSCRRTEPPSTLMLALKVVMNKIPHETRDFWPVARTFKFSISSPKNNWKENSLTHQSAIMNHS